MPDTLAPAPVRAGISHGALRENLARLLGADSQAVADLRRDAWGHGVTGCARIVAAAGLPILADDADAALLSRGGVTGVITRPDAHVADAATLWGLPGGGGVPVMSLRASVLGTKPLLAGEGVSYGYTFRAAQPTVVALVGGGYAQGVVREIGDRVSVHIDGVAARVVGRVAMDACVVDVGTARVETGAEVVFFGDPAAGEPDLACWTEATGLTAEEIVGLIGARAHREGLP